MNIIWILSLLGIILLYMIYLGLHSNFSSKQYILNTYLYVILGFVIYGETWTILEQYKLSIYFTKYMQIFLILIGMSLFFVLYLPNDKIIIRHFAWLIFNICVASFSYNIYEKYSKNHLLEKLITELLIIIFSISIVAYFLPYELSDNFNCMLFIMLCLLAFTEFINIFYFSTYTNQYGLIKFFLFSGFLLYDMQRIIYKSKFLEISDQNKNIDYLSESLNIYLDIINICFNYKK